MTLADFEKELTWIRASNGWRIELDLVSVWLVRVYDKETYELIDSTGVTDLGAVLFYLKNLLKGLRSN